MSVVSLRCSRAGYVLDASRTSGESRATIMVGDVMSGAACMAVFSLDMRGDMQFDKHTAPSGSPIAVEVEDLCRLVSLSSLSYMRLQVYIHPLRNCSGVGHGWMSCGVD